HVYWRRTPLLRSGFLTVGFPRYRYFQARIRHAIFNMLLSLLPRDSPIYGAHFYIPHLPTWETTMLLISIVLELLMRIALVSSHVYSFAKVVRAQMILQVQELAAYRPSFRVHRISS
ncbi:uncharacterized protein EI90DRAFT_3065359, partial [Cantharellus anzutake]|uniref:uncharacterized protein n=1 Tax=Cantharellus anzutake TaxID=1750568 RepID=UPI0019035D06